MKSSVNKAVEESRKKLASDDVEVTAGLNESKGNYITSGDMNGDGKLVVYKASDGVPSFDKIEEQENDTDGHESVSLLKNMKKT